MIANPISTTTLLSILEEGEIMITSSNDLVSEAVLVGSLMSCTSCNSEQVSNNAFASGQDVLRRLQFTPMTTICFPSKRASVYLGFNSFLMQDTGQSGGPQTINDLVSFTCVCNRG